MSWPTKTATIVLVALVLLVGTGGTPATAQELPLDEPPAPEEPFVPAPDEVPEPEDPTFSVTLGEDSEVSRSVALLLLLTVGAVLPGLLLVMTSFTRYVVVLGITKNALGLQTIPPTQILVGLALFLTVFTMAPTFGEVNDAAVQPLLDGEIGAQEAMDAGFAPFRHFMLEQTPDDDLRLFSRISGAEIAPSRADVSASVLVPAFVVSELRSAFLIGFVIFVPFLVIDLVVAAVLMSMGMVMLPPVFISLPLKLLLFVLVDGWSLIIQSLVGSVGVLA